MNRIASPCAHSASTRSMMSNFAATSMPRVGSSRISSFGSVASQRASSTFCWLPPDSSPIGCSASRALMPSRAMYVSASSRCRARPISRHQPRRACSARMMFSRIDSAATMPSFLRSSGQYAMPLRTASCGDASRVRAPSISIAPVSARSAANASCAVSVRPEPSSPASPTISPGRTSRSSGLIIPRRPTCCIDRNGSASPAVRSTAAAPACSVSDIRSRPVIFATSTSTGKSRARYSPSRSPLRITVIRSDTA